MSQRRDAVIVGAVRTPIGKGKGTGTLHGVAPRPAGAHPARTGSPHRS